jgi:tubulin polyglutamylase TTLL6/13
MYLIARKNMLARNLKRLQKLLPEEYKFFPKTWIVPAEINDLKANMLKKKMTLIVKPEASS